MLLTIILQFSVILRIVLTYIKDWMSLFSALKKFWQQECDKEEQENGQKVLKTNFLSVYGCAHLWALTPANIETAFKKTGVYPFIPSIITDDKFIPACETAIKHHAIIPMRTPVGVLVNAFTQLSGGDGSCRKEGQWSRRMVIICKMIEKPRTYLMSLSHHLHICQKPHNTTFYW